MTTDECDAAGDGGTGPDGVEHRAPADGRRPPLRRLRRERRRGVRARRPTAPAAPTTIEDFVAKLEKPRAVWVMVPAGEITDKTIAALAEELEPGDIDHRRRQHPLPRRHPPRQRAARAGHPPRRLRDQRRRLGPRSRLLPDDRRRARGRATALPDLRLGRAGRRLGAAHARAHRRARARPSRATCTAGPTAPGTS